LIEILIHSLDAADGYSTTELEEDDADPSDATIRAQANSAPGDLEDDEPCLGTTEHLNQTNAGLYGRDGWTTPTDFELDDSDDEPSLAACDVAQWYRCQDGDSVEANTATRAVLSSTGQLVRRMTAKAIPAAMTGSQASVESMLTAVTAARAAIRSWTTATWSRALDGPQKRPPMVALALARLADASTSRRTRAKCGSAILRKPALPIAMGCLNNAEACIPTEPGR